MLFPAQEYGGSNVTRTLLPVATSTAIHRAGCDRQAMCNCSCVQSCGDSVAFKAAESDSDSNYTDIDVDAVGFDVPCWEKDVNYDYIPEEELLASTRRVLDDVDNENNYDWDDSTSNVPFWWM